nr:hypothetical protein [Tanacetum cinerariifolium]
MDLKWQMAMLTMSAKRFLKRTRKNLGANGTDTIGFDMSKVKCYNCHRRGHFVKECRSPRDNRNKETTRRPVLAEVSTSNDLVSKCDAVGGYDWCFQDEETSTNYAFMTYNSSGSLSSLGSDNKVAPCSKACSKAYATLQTHYDNLIVEFRKPQLDVLSYKTGLESVEASHESENRVPKNLENDRYKPGEWYHAVPPLYTRTFMPSKPDLVFTDDPTANFEEISRGYIAFGGNPKDGKISSKGKIKAGKLDSDDVYFVKELKFNIFSVSQMVPRENNMYNVDLKNVVPSGGLTCLFAKATLDESNLWHRRLGHINFKTMNKLVKGNLVRGLPSKIFENNHTCVACQKGKQHKAS